jgi:hypothetical protein
MCLLWNWYVSRRTRRVCKKSTKYAVIAGEIVEHLPRLDADTCAMAETMFAVVPFFRLFRKADLLALAAKLPPDAEHQWRLLAIMARMTIDDPKSPDADIWHRIAHDDMSWYATVVAMECATRPTTLPPAVAYDLQMCRILHGWTYVVEI